MKRNGDKNKHFNYFCIYDTYAALHYQKFFILIENVQTGTTYTVYIYRVGKFPTCRFPTKFLIKDRKIQKHVATGNPF